MNFFMACVKELLQVGLLWIVIGMVAVIAVPITYFVRSIMINSKKGYEIRDRFLYLLSNGEVDSSKTNDCGLKASYEFMLRKSEKSALNTFCTTVLGWPFYLERVIPICEKTLNKVREEFSQTT